MKHNIENIKTDRGIHRTIMIEMGVYNIHKEKVYKNKKAYTRKQKHKNNYE